MNDTEIDRNMGFWQLIRFSRTLIGIGLLLGLAPAVTRAASPVLNKIRYQGVAVTGDVAALSNPLLPERTQPDIHNSVLFGHEGSAVVVDLGYERPVKGLLVQAGHEAQFAVEGSVDGRVWQRLWDVPAAFKGIGVPPMGLRSRLISLSSPVHLRWLRLRAQPGSRFDSPSSASLSRWWIADDSLTIWPPELDYSLPRSRPPLFPKIDLSTATILSIFLASWALVVFTWVTAVSGSEKRNRKSTVQVLLLGVTLLLSMVAWPNFLNFHWGSYYHPHEFFHYLLGAKYTEELRYVHLYECSLIAEAESGKDVASEVRIIRDLGNNSLISASQVLLSPDRCRSRFTAQRWESFKRDVGWLRDRLPGSLARQRVFQDHGFNASPAWLLLGRPMASRADLSDSFVFLLACLDLLLLGASLAMLLRGFGAEAMAAVAVFFCLNPISFFRYTGGSFLRYDWFFLLVVAIFALKKERNALAGFALAGASLLRVFPGLLFLGLLLRIAGEALEARSLEIFRKTRGLLVGATLCVAVVVPLSIFVAGRVGVWNEFIDNSRKHLATESVNFMGLETVLEGLESIGTRGENNLASPEKVIENSRGPGWSVGLRLLIVGAFFLGFWRATRGRELWLAAVLAVGLIPLLTTLSNYYYVVLALYGAVWTVERLTAYGLVFLGWITWLPMAVLNSRSQEYWAASVLVLLFVALSLATSKRRRHLAEEGLAAATDKSSTVGTTIPNGMR